MYERKPGNTAGAMSRARFLGGLALLAGALGLTGVDLPALVRRAGPPVDPDPASRPAAPPAITPPTRSVKRRG